MDAILTPAPMTAAARRRAFAKRIKNGLLALTAAPPKTQSRDIDYFPYAPDNYLYYLTGIAEPHCALLLTAQDGVIRDEIFFCRQFDALTTRWQGPYLNTRTAKKRAGFAQVADITALAKTIRQLAPAAAAFYFLPGHSEPLDAIARDIARRRRADNRAGARAPDSFVDAAAVLDEMRLIKDADEIARISAACDLSAAAMQSAMRAAPAARAENEIEAALIRHYRAGGAHHAFAPIVAGGRRACYLHYTDNNAPLRRGDMVLVDTGARIGGYAGDITRAFPKNGKWNAAARAVYDVVLSAQRRALRRAVVGARWQSVEDAATRELCAGLRDLGLRRGQVKNIIAREDYRRFYMHRIGHWLGLDVHDVGTMRAADGRSRQLRAGMVCTIEPGLYIPDESDIPRHLRGIGVRIEDDIVITKSGNRVLTGDAPKTPAQISACVLG